MLEFRANYLHGGSANPDAPLKWKLTAAAGGGVIADLASHVLDLVEHLLGPLRSLSAATHIAYPQRPACGAKEKETGVRSQETGGRSTKNGERSTANLKSQISNLKSLQSPIANPQSLVPDPHHNGRCCPSMPKTA